MRRLALALALLVAGREAAAQDWTRLTGEDLISAFTARTLQYDNGAVQEFRQTGVTTVEHGSYREGRWWVQDDLLCTQWDSSRHKDCFSVERKNTGLDLRLSGSGGGAVTLRYIDLH